MKALLVLPLLLLQISQCFAAEPSPGNAPSMLQLDFGAQIPFWVDRRGQTHPDSSYYEPSKVSDTETLYTPKSTDDQSRISVIRSADGILQSIIRSDRKNNLNTVMDFTSPTHLISQTTCRGGKCLDVSPSLCKSLLDAARVSDMKQLMETQIKCNTLANAFDEALDRTRSPNKQDKDFPKSIKSLYGSKAWMTSNRSMFDSVGAPNPNTYNQSAETRLTNDQVRLLTQRQADILQTCVQYESLNIFKSRNGSPVRTSPTKSDSIHRLFDQ